MDSDSTDYIVVSIADESWLDLVSDPDALCRRALVSVLENIAPDESGAIEIGVRLTDDAEIRDLNRTYRNKDGATNVLSFQADSAALARAHNMPRQVGDIVVASGVTAFEAAAEGITVADHLAHLVVHGALHLLGFDHETDEDAEVMETKEVEILEMLGVANPYEREVPA